MVILYSKEVSPLQMKRAIQKYKKMKKFLEKCDENTQKDCIKASEGNKVLKVFPTVVNESKDSLQSKSSSMEVGFDKKNLFIEDSSKSRTNLKPMASNKLKKNHTNVKSAAKPEKRPVKIFKHDKMSVDHEENNPQSLKYKLRQKIRLEKQKRERKQNKKLIKYKFKPFDWNSFVLEFFRKDESQSRQKATVSNKIPETPDFIDKNVDSKKPAVTPKTSSPDILDEKGSKSVAKIDIEKIKILNGINHISLEIFFRDILKAISKSFLPTNDDEKPIDKNTSLHAVNNSIPMVKKLVNSALTKEENCFIEDICPLKNVNKEPDPKSRVKSISKTIDQLFSKYVSADKTIFATHNEVRSISTNFVTILCKIWREAVSQIETSTSNAAAEEIIKNAQDITKLLSIYCSSMHECYSKISRFWSRKSVSFDVEFYNRLAESGLKANDDFSAAIRDLGFKEELCKVVEANAKVLGEFMTFVTGLAKPRKSQLKKS